LGAGVGGMGAWANSAAALKRRCGVEPIAGSDRSYTDQAGQGDFLLKQLSLGTAGTSGHSAVGG
jgi:hypothetical protein